MGLSHGKWRPHKQASSQTLIDSECKLIVLGELQEDYMPCPQRLGWDVVGTELDEPLGTLQALISDIWTRYSVSDVPCSFALLCFGQGLLVYYWVLSLWAKVEWVNLREQIFFRLYLEPKVKTLCFAPSHWPMYAPGAAVQGCHGCEENKTRKVSAIQMLWELEFHHCITSQSALLQRPSLTAAKGLRSTGIQNSNFFVMEALGGVCEWNMT